MSSSPLRWALISVFNKTGIATLAEFLVSKDFHILSTGGTYLAIHDILSASGHADHLHKVSDVTGFPEILDGRVKTLHPKIHGALLARRDDPDHLQTMTDHQIPNITLVVSNLYPFQETVQTEGATHQQILEKIDIGGPTMIRAAAKNYKDILVVTDPNDYLYLASEFDRIESSDTQREKLALKAFQHTAEYDAAIMEYLSKEIDPDHPITTRMYKQTAPLKYGCNPYQSGAAIHDIIYPQHQGNTPFTVLNGKPGYINYLDAVGSYGLVRDLKISLPDHPVVAASFKHTSPAGVGTSHPLSDLLKQIYDVEDKLLTPAATAYVRARQADPLSSFGDFVAISDTVDVATAKLLKREVSDGIIAPGYEPEALEILRKKKNGNFIIIEVNDPEWNPDTTEFREISGTAISQSRNTELTTPDDLVSDNIITRQLLPPRPDNPTALNSLPSPPLSPATIRDLIIANTTLKYTQSNSVCIAYDGQCVGVGSGQQNRVACVELASQKALIWLMRQCQLEDDKIYNSPAYFQNLKISDPTLKRQDRVNKTIAYCRERLESFEDDGHSFQEILGPNNYFSLASDAFFPFPDSIEAAPAGITKYILQPGGSSADPTIIELCNQLGITMVFSGKRMFTH